jgi:hypothetical protein
VNGGPAQANCTNANHQITDASSRLIEFFFKFKGRIREL